MRTLVFSVLSTLPLAGAWAQAAVPTDFPADAEVAADAALRQRFADRVFRVQPAAGPGWRLEFKAGGYVFLDTDSGTRDTGRWRIEGTRLCVDWQRVNSGCVEMRILEDVLYMKRGSGEVVALRPK